MQDATEFVLQTQIETGVSSSINDVAYDKASISMSTAYFYILVVWFYTYSESG